MLEELKAEVCEANRLLKASGLAVLTWGNASGIDRDQGLVVIKPSGVGDEEMTAERMVVVALDGEVVEGELRPSSDTPTHLILYQELEGIGGVAHTHSTYTSAWAQAQRSIPCYGTTQADHFRGAVPITEPLTAEAVGGEYELETGRAIVRAMEGRAPREFPGVLVASHGPFTWGESARDAANNSIILEQVARMAAVTEGLAPMVGPISRQLRDKHFLRKHGAEAYYGQPS